MARLALQRTTNVEEKYYVLYTWHRTGGGEGPVEVKAGPYSKRDAEWHKEDIETYRTASNVRMLSESDLEALANPIVVPNYREPEQDDIARWAMYWATHFGEDLQGTKQRIREIIYRQTINDSDDIAALAYLLKNAGG